MIQIKSNYSEWSDISNKWYNTANNKVDNLYNAFDEAKNAVKEVSRQRDIGSLGLALTLNDIEEHNENRRKLVSFCNAIHYEISELVDNPFCVKAAETVQNAYDLNPSNIEVKTGSFLGFSLKSSLTDLVGTTYTDDKLKADFEKKSKGLDKDKVSGDLSDAMLEAEFWKNEFVKSAECQKIAEEVFNNEVRKQWASLSEDTKKEIIEDYVQRIGQVLYGERNFWDKLWGNHPSIVNNVAYNASGYGVSYGNGTIGINDLFVSDSTKNYSVDKVIDTLTHETRHQYQHEVTNNPQKYGAPQSLMDEWNQPYIGSPYEKYYGQDVERDARGFAALSRPESEGDS